MTLLELLQQAVGELGLPIPVAIVGNTAQDTVQQFRVINACGRDLAALHNWQALQIAYRFTTSYLSATGTTVNGSAVITGLSSTTGLDSTYMLSGAGIPQDCFVVTVDSPSQVTVNQPLTASGTSTITFGKVKYALPSDWKKQINRTQWDKTAHWEMLGPETAQQWEWLKSGYIATGPRVRYRIFGNYFQIWPMFSTSRYLGFEYVSRNWALSATGTAQSEFEADTDTCVYDDGLIIAMFKLRYWQTKGYDATQFNMDFNNLLSIAKATDAGAQTLNLSGSPLNVLISPANIPDSGYGSTP